MQLVDIDMTTLDNENKIIEKNPENIDSPLLCLTEKEGEITQSFVHDTLDDFFSARRMMMEGTDVKTLTRNISSSIFYGFYFDFGGNKDNVIEEIFAYLSEESVMGNMLSYCTLINIIDSNRDISQDLLFNELKKLIKKKEYVFTGDKEHPLRDLCFRLGAINPNRLSTLLLSTPDTYLGEHLNEEIILGVSHAIKKDPSRLDKTSEDILLNYSPPTGYKSRVQTEDYLELLGRIRSERTISRLMEFADPDSDTFDAVIRIITGFEDERYIPGLIDILRTHKNDPPRRQILDVGIDYSVDMVAYELKGIGKINNENYNAVIACDEDTAIARAREEKIDLVITGLYCINVRELVSSLRETYSGPIIIYSSVINSIKEEDIKFFRKNHVLRIDKSIRISDFAEVIKEIMPRADKNATGIAERSIRTAIQRLGEKALPQLTPYLHDPDPYIRRFAEEMIGGR